MSNVCLIQENINTAIEQISINYNSILCHSLEDIDRLTDTKIIISDKDSIDLACSKIEQFDFLVSGEILPTIEDTKKLVVELWQDLNRIEQIIYKDL